MKIFKNIYVVALLFSINIGCGIKNSDTVKANDTDQGSVEFYKNLKN